MTGEERVLTALKEQEHDHLCWAPLVDQYLTSSLPGQGYQEVSVPEAIRMMAVDIMELHSSTLWSILRSFAEWDARAIWNAYLTRRRSVP